MLIYRTPLAGPYPCVLHFKCDAAIFSRCRQVQLQPLGGGLLRLALLSLLEIPHCLKLFSARCGAVSSTD